MVMKKKGVSDVISTVLIILLVLAAVGIVGAIVLRSVGQSSQQVDAGSTCSTTSVVVTSCTGVGRAYTVARYLTSSSSQVTGIYLYQTGAPATGDIKSNLGYDGATYSSIHSGSTTSPLYTVVTYANGASCTSTPVACS